MELRKEPKHDRSLIVLPSGRREHTTRQIHLNPQLEDRLMDLLTSITKELHAVQSNAGAKSNATTVADLWPAYTYPSLVTHLDRHRELWEIAIATGLPQTHYWVADWFQRMDALLVRLLEAHDAAAGAQRTPGEQPRPQPTYDLVFQELDGTRKALEPDEDDVPLFPSLFSPDLDE